MDQVQMGPSLPTCCTVEWENYFPFNHFLKTCSVSISNKEANQCVQTLFSLWKLLWLHQGSVPGARLPLTDICWPLKSPAAQSCVTSTVITHWLGKSHCFPWRTKINNNNSNLMSCWVKPEVLHIAFRAPYKHLSSLSDLRSFKPPSRHPPRRIFCFFSSSRTNLSLHLAHYLDTVPQRIHETHLMSLSLSSPQDAISKHASLLPLSFKLCFFMVPLLVTFVSMFIFLE